MRNSTATVGSRNPCTRLVRCLDPLRCVQTIRGSGDCEFASSASLVGAGRVIISVSCPFLCPSFVTPRSSAACSSTCDCALDRAPRRGREERGAGARGEGDKHEKGAEKARGREKLSSQDSPVPQFISTHLLLRFEYEACASYAFHLHCWQSRRRR